MQKDRLVWFSALAFAGLLAGVCLFRPGSTPLLPPCPFHLLTGLYCFGCGSTRMLYQLLHGHPALAFAQNPLAFLMLPLVVYGLARQLFSARPAVFSTVRPMWLWILGILLVGFTVLRNLPYEPFSYLAPGGLAQFF